MLVTLTPIVMIGKRSAGEDFGLLVGQTTSSVEAVARVWLQVYLNTRNPMVVAFQVVDGEPWLFRAQGDRGTDAAGRPRALVVFGRVSGLPPGSVFLNWGLIVPNLLLAYGRLPLVPDVEHENHIAVDFEPHHVGFDPTADIPADCQVFRNDVLAAQAAVALAIEGHAVVAKMEDAVTTLCRFAPLVRWVGLLPKDCPPRLPEGIGLAISHDHGAPPDTIQQIVGHFGPDELLDLPLADLATISDRSELRRMLLCAALGAEPCEVSANDVSLAGIEWLSATAKGRTSAVNLVSQRSSEDISRWLKSAHAVANDIALLRGRLTDEHCSLVRRVLEEPSAEHFALYADMFPNDCEGLCDLLPQEMMVAFDALQHGNVKELSQGELEECLALILETGLPDEIPLEQLALAAIHGGARCLEAFGRRLTNEGLPEELMRILLHEQHCSPKCWTESPPKIEPVQTWLQGIDPHRWLQVGRTLPVSPAWRKWWCGGVREFIDCGILDRSAVVREGVQQNRMLLVAVGLPEEIVTLIHHEPDEEKVPLPTTWNGRDEVVEEWVERYVADGTLFERLRPPLSSEAFKWIEDRVKDRNVQDSVREARNDLEHKNALPLRWLSWIGRLLTKKRLLEQIAAWALKPLSAERRKALNLLLQHPHLAADEKAWLQARTMDCLPLPAPPAWTIPDMLALLPVLDPVRDVIPHVLERPSRGSGEEELLWRVVETVRGRAATPYYAATALARELRPDWVAALCDLPGWEGFGGDCDTLLTDISSRCRRLKRITDGRLPDDIRAAIEQLAGRDS